jgi:hypothetical protein
VDRDDAPWTSEQGARFDFLSFVERLRVGLAVATREGSPRVDPVEVLMAIRRAIERRLQASQPLPARLRRIGDELRRELATIDGLASGAATPSGAASLFHPLVRALLWMNHAYAAETAGRDVADEELHAITRNLTRKPKGRPATIAMGVVREAKRLRDDGLSYARIARKLHLKDGPTIRSALAYHFPTESREKKSSRLTP